MWMTAVSHQRDLVVRTHPCRNGVSIADLPVQALFRLADDSGNSGITVCDELSYCVHVTRLEPRLLDIFGILVSDDPVELLAVAKRVLHEMPVFPDPDIHTFFLYELGRQGIAPQVCTFEKGSEACIA